MSNSIQLRNREVQVQEIKKNPNFANKTKIANQLRKTEVKLSGEPAKNYVQLRMNLNQRRKLYRLLRDVLDEVRNSKFKNKICAAYGTLLGKKK